MSRAFCCGITKSVASPTTRGKAEKRRKRKRKTYVGSVLHGSPPSANLSSVTLDKSSVNGVGKREFGKVLGDILLHLVLLETSGLLESLGRDDGGNTSFVRDGGEVLVGDNLDDIPFTAVLDNLVSDGGSLAESGDVLADSGEGDLERLGHGTGELGLGLVTDDGEGTGLLDHLLLDVSRDGRVDTTTETTVRGDTDVEDLGLGFRLGLGVLEQLCFGGMMLGGLLIFFYSLKALN